MSQIKTDLRVRRTRKSIMDAFISLSEKKEFKDITIKDITNEAMINRATFYYHFEDIYDLLEKVLSEVLLINLDMENFQNQELNEETLIHILKRSRIFKSLYPGAAIAAIRIRSAGLSENNWKSFFTVCC